MIKVNVPKGQNISEVKRVGNALILKSECGTHQIDAG